jgi:hypothetical protein
VIRLGHYTYEGRERHHQLEIEAVLIPWLERRWGPNHVVVHKAREKAGEVRAAEQEAYEREAEHFLARLEKSFDGLL